MITVNCSQCKALLEMDDAFAGGVCRCHYCGTIQAVPANARRKEAAPVAVAAGASNNGPAAGGLDALADAVASSGLSRGALQAPVRQPAARPAATATVDYAHPSRRKGLPLGLLIALGVIAVLLLIIGFLVIGGSRATTTVAPLPPGGAPAVPPGRSNPVPNDDGSTTPNADPDAPVVVPKSPHFCGISLENVPSVVYVLDRGEATAELFDTLKETTYRSLESLKAGQQFQIIFWDNADPPAAYPPDGLVAVSPQEIDAARAQFADVLAGGRARADTAVQRAAANKPAVIIVVTGKAFDLENSVADATLAAVRGTGTKVHTVALRSDDNNPVLKQIATKSNGEFRVISAKELRDYSY